MLAEVTRVKELPGTRKAEYRLEETHSQETNLVSITDMNAALSV